MIHKEIVAKCKEQGLVVKGLGQGIDIQFIKTWKEWDGRPRAVTLSIDYSQDISDELMQIIISNLEDEYHRRKLPSKDLVLKEWVSAKEISRMHNVPYQWVLKDCRKGGPHRSTKINNRWYCHPQG